MQKVKYLDELNEDSLRKDIIYSCEASLKEVEPEDDEETRNLIQHEEMFNKLSIS